MTAFIEIGNIIPRKWETKGHWIWPHSYVKWCGVVVGEPNRSGGGRCSLLQPWCAILQHRWLLSALAPLGLGLNSDRYLSHLWCEQSPWLPGALWSAWPGPQVSHSTVTAVTSSSCHLCGFSSGGLCRVESPFTSSMVLSFPESSGLGSFVYTPRHVVKPCSDIGSEPCFLCPPQVSQCPRKGSPHAQQEQELERRDSCNPPCCQGHLFPLFVEVVLQRKS
jgi:hypothetical protein